MVYRFGKDRIPEQLFRQIDSFYGISEEERDVIRQVLDAVLGKTERTFSRCANKYYHKNEETYFDPLHTCQWFVFLYQLAHELYRNDCDRVISDKIYNLSKIISGCDLYYEVEMPQFFFCEHPVGAVLGRAKYGEYFSFSQGCTVGNNHGFFPVMGDHVTMFADSRILGNCHIGNDVTLAANAFVKDRDIPNHSIVFGQDRDLIIKEKNDELPDHVFLK